MDAKNRTLVELSSALAGIVDAGAPSVLRVEGRRRSAASGVAWSEDGLVVAPNHAIEWDEAVGIGLPDGARAEADVVGRDATTDVALLRAKGVRLRPADLGAAPPAVGQLVVGVSRPGKTHRAALGIVARVAGEWRAPAGGRVDGYVETTLPIARGLSGSLVLDGEGGVLGIVTAGLLRGAAMVLPEATLRRVVGALLEHGHVTRGYLGVATLPVRLPEGAAKAAGQPGALLVTAVVEGSPAGKAGLLLGDAITSFGGEPVADLHALLGHLEPERIGAAVPVRLIRAGAPQELTLTVGSRPRGEGE